MAENKWVKNIALTAALAGTALPGCGPNEKPAPDNKPKAAAVATDTPPSIEVAERESASPLANAKSAIFFNGTAMDDTLTYSPKATKALETADFVAVNETGAPDNNWKPLLKKREGKVTAATINIVGLEDDHQAVLDKVEAAVKSGFNAVYLVADNKWTGSNTDVEKHAELAEFMTQIKQKHPGLLIVAAGLSDASIALNGGAVDALVFDNQYNTLMSLPEGEQPDGTNPRESLNNYLSRRTQLFTESGGAVFAIEKTQDPAQAAAAAAHWRNLGAVPYISTNEHLLTVNPNQPGQSQGVVPGGPN